MVNGEKPVNVRNHKKLCMFLNDLYEQKNEAYGNSFSRTYEEYGPTMLCIRLDDKLNRAKQLLLKGAEENDETVIDTLLDLANYAIMGGYGDSKWQKDQLSGISSVKRK